MGGGGHKTVILFACGSVCRFQPLLIKKKQKPGRKASLLNLFHVHVGMDGPVGKDPQRVWTQGRNENKQDSTTAEQWREKGKKNNPTFVLYHNLRTLT